MAVPVFYGVPVKDRKYRRSRICSEALVCPVAISFIDDIDVRTGEFKEIEHFLFGETIRNKILIFPGSIGGRLNSIFIKMLASNGAAPSAFIMPTADRDVITGALISGIPYLYSVTPDPVSIINSGDEIYVNPYRGEVKMITHRDITGETDNEIIDSQIDAAIEGMEE